MTHTRQSKPPQGLVFFERIGDHWVAGTAAANVEATGATPSEAIKNMASQEGFDAEAISWLEGLRERRAKSDALMDQITQDKQTRKQLLRRRNAAERAAPNVVRLRPR